MISAAKPVASEKEYIIRSAKEAIEQDVPDIDYCIEGWFRKRAKCAVIGKWKVAKSFLTMQMGMSISAGQDFMGFKTTPSNVLYINFEISEEMFHQRIQDMHEQLKYDLSRFKYVTLTDLSLDLKTDELELLLSQAKGEGFPVEVLIIDPRWKAIKKDSNQDEVVNAFCVNLDKVIDIFKVAVIVVHHEGVSTGADKAGKGSTVFDAWLDGWCKIKPKSSGNLREIDVWSRDSERETVSVDFTYPIHVAAPEAISAKKEKTEQAKKVILEILSEGEQLQKEVRQQVMKRGSTSYSYWSAKKELEKAGIIETHQASGQGNSKSMRLVEKKEQ